MAQRRCTCVDKNVRQCIAYCRNWKDLCRNISETLLSPRPLRLSQWHCETGLGSATIAWVLAEPYRHRLVTV